MSRAVVATGYGTPDVLDVVEIEQPRPGPGEVLIEVRAAGVNPIDHKLYSGAMGADPAALPLRLGFEVSGVVAALGEGVTGVAAGDEVIAYRVDGGYATHVVAAVADVFAKPEALSFAQASGLLLTGVTAVHLLTATGVGAGDTVLVHGASGGVGLIVTQLAVARGARVIGTAGAARLDAVRAFGGEPVTYGEGLAQRVRELAPSGIDVALDTVGTDEAVDTSIELVTDRSRIASIAAFGRAPGLGIALLGGGPGADPGTAVRAAARQPLVGLARAGRLIVTLDRTFPLDEAGEAHAYLAAGHAQGKLALIP